MYKQVIDYRTLSTLYTFSEKSLLVISLLVLSFTYYFIQVIPYQISIWATVFILLLLYRGYTAFVFKNNFIMHSLVYWHYSFLIASLFTALLLAILPILVFQNIDTLIDHLVIIMVLVGYAAGSHVALFVYVRLAIVYIFILLSPLIVILVTYGIDLYLTLALFMVFHLLALTLMILQNYKYHRYIDKVFLDLDNNTSLLNKVMHQSPLPIFQCNTNLDIIDLNQSFAKLLQQQKEVVLGINMHDLKNRKLLACLKEALAEGSSQYIGEYASVLLPDISWWVEIIFLAQYDNTKELVGVIGLIEDKTVEHNALQQLEYRASHDLLTSLLNRRGLMDIIEKQIEVIDTQKVYSLLFYLDLNQFKVINDTLGHTIGDKLLIKIASRLTKNLHDKCNIARLGGDEFILSSKKKFLNIETTQRLQRTYLDKIEDVFNEVFVIDEIHLYMTTSIGVVILEPKKQKVEDILSYADLTMYRAKKTKTNISYYDSTIDSRQKDLLSLQHDLSYAMQNNEFAVYLQPIVALENNNLYASELLLRWEHPKHGLLYPDQFIPLAVKAGLLFKITWWIFDTLFTQIKQWKESGSWNLHYISVNINATQLAEKDFVSTLIQKIKQSSLHPSEIVLEITERSLIDSFEQTQDTITKLKEYGVSCAIDDFGVGYSSLSYLKKLSCSILKIDKIFIQDINDENIYLLSTIIDLAKKFNYIIIVEGIETQEDKNLIQSLDSHLFYQGYLYSHPIKIEKLYN